MFQICVSKTPVHNHMLLMLFSVHKARLHLVVIHWNVWLYLLWELGYILQTDIQNHTKYIKIWENNITYTLNFMLVPSLLGKLKSVNKIICIHWRYLEFHTKLFYLCQAPQELVLLLLIFSGLLMLVISSENTGSTLSEHNRFFWKNMPKIL